MAATSRLGRQLAEILGALLRANRDTLNMAEVREYFKLFERESLLDELIKQIG